MFTNELLFVCMCLVVRRTVAQVSEGTPCETSDGQYGTCINIRNCDVVINLLTTRSNDPQVRTYLRSLTCGYIDTTPMVCCPQAKPRTTQPPLVDAGNEPSLRSSVQLPISPNCGFSNVSVPRVVGGIPAKLGQYPWIVALGYKNSKNPGSPKWLCGGTLITDVHILTAGHCVHNRVDLYLARVGELDLFSDDDGASPEDINLVKAKIHEDYSPTTFTNDIAIITMARKPSTNTVWPVCLPAREPLRSNTFLKYEPFVAGWGALYFNGPSSSLLQQTKLPVLNNDMCKKAFGNKTVIDHRIICAGYISGGKDACQGDSGGPLMYIQAEPNNLRVHQIGIVSYGFRCAEAGYPGVYTRVTNFIDWIQRNLN